MAIGITKKELNEMMQKAFPFVPSKSTLQILSNFKIQFKDGELEIEATDFDHSIKVTKNVEGDGSFSITVNAKKIFEIIRELPEGKVTIDVDENIVLLKTESGFSCKIAGADTESFPGFPEINESTEIEISLSLLKSLIHKSSFAVAKDESRAFLCGVLWIIENNRTGMVATDGHRLGSSFIPGQFAVSENLNPIISTKTLSQIVHLAESEQSNTNIRVYVNSKYILFANDSIKLCTKLFEGPYPDYDKVIPKNNPKKAQLSRTLLLESLRRLSVLSNQKTHLVKFAFSHDSLEMSVRNVDIGAEAHEIIPIKYDGENHIIGFNAQFLSEILGIITDQNIFIEMNTQISASLILPAPVEGKENKEKSTDLFLIMPLRIMEEVVA